MAPVTLLYEKGDTVYYPKLTVPSEKTMTVKDRYIGRGPSGIFVQYLSDDLLDRLVEDMHENADNGMDNIVVITGPERGTGEGVGKSNLGYWVAKKYDPDFNLEDGYVYDMLPFLERVASGNMKGKVLMLDEGTNLLSARNWMSETNKSVDQVLEMFRSYRMTIIICIPKLYRLDEYVRESRMHYHLTCQIRYWDGDTHPKRGYFELKKEPNFRTICWGTFPQIPEKERGAYEHIKAQSQQKKAQELLEKFRDNQAGGSRLQKSASHNRKLAMFLKNEGYSYARISEETGIPEGTLRYWISEENNKENDEND